MADTKPTWEEQVQKCSNEVKAVLDRFQMVLDVSVVLKENQVRPMINLIPKPPVEAPKEEPKKEEIITK